MKNCYATYDPTSSRRGPHNSVKVPGNLDATVAQGRELLESCRGEIEVGRSGASSAPIHNLDLRGLAPVYGREKIMIKCLL